MPFVTKRLRENLRMYNTLPPKNITDELRPWTTISISPPENPMDVKYINLTITKPIWATEEYAITTFKSNWFKQISPMIPAPNILIEINKSTKNLE